MGNLFFVGQHTYKKHLIKTCSKCRVRYKPFTIIGKRYSCRVHTIVNGICVDCHINTTIYNNNCRHIPGISCCCH